MTIGKIPGISGYGLLFDYDHDQNLKILTMTIVTSISKFLGAKMINLKCDYGIELEMSILTIDL